MEPRTALTAAVPISPPTSRAPEIAVTSVFLTRFTMPTETVPLPLIARWIAASTLPFVAGRVVVGATLDAREVLRLGAAAPARRLAAISSPRVLGRFGPLSPRTRTPPSPPRGAAAH